eukprot:TRINITY_DN5523_c0_g1_i10.p1 TRINITY_DN5523_c0_g1~~TRINITY_DN5523_c0_g1_i10.p1  ORF type:complete len:412 (-),score=56.61 TRINITY_DN5523_c0_g1_i10:25-1170(-)
MSHPYSTRDIPLDSILSVFPSLRSFYLFCSADIVFLSQSSQSPRHVWPPLTKLHLYCNISPEWMYTLSSLRSLYLSLSRYHHSLPDFGRLFPHLETLSLVIHFSSTDLLPCVEAWSTTMPSLTRLTLRTHLLTRFADFVTLLRHFSAPQGLTSRPVWPALESLSLLVHSFRAYVPLDEPIRLLPTLKYVSFERTINMGPPRPFNEVLNSVEAENVEIVDGDFLMWSFGDDTIPALARAFPRLKYLQAENLTQGRFEFWQVWASCRLAHTLEHVSIGIDSERTKSVSTWNVASAMLSEVGAALTALRYLSIYIANEDDDMFKPISVDNPRLALHSLLVMISHLPSLRKLCLSNAVLQFQDGGVVESLSDLEARGVLIVNSGE